MSRLHHPLTLPFVVAPPFALHGRDRLRFSERDEFVTEAVGAVLSHLRNADLALRCRLGLEHESKHWAERKRALTAETSSRWAGTITGVNNAAWGTARRNQIRHLNSLRQAVGTLDDRLSVEPGKRVKVGTKWVSGYADENERAMKSLRRERLAKRLAEVESDVAAGRVSICLGGKALARKRMNLEAAGLTSEEWKREWRAARLFLRADGESGKPFGNETIRVTPEGRIYLKLPKCLEHLANAPDGRYLYDAVAKFQTRREEWLRQVEGKRAVCYEFSFDPKRNRWYLDFSLTPPAQQQPKHLTLSEALDAGALGVDLNDGLIAAWVLDPNGNPVGEPIRLPLSLKGLPADTRDGHLREAITRLIGEAAHRGIRAIVVEDLNFENDKADSRERYGRKKSFRRTLHGIPVSAFRQRLVAMAARRGIAVVAVPPQYSSVWGEAHWQEPLSTPKRAVDRHEAAAVVIGRRGQGLSARRRGVQSPSERQGTAQAGPPGVGLMPLARSGRGPSGRGGAKVRPHAPKGNTRTARVGKTVRPTPCNKRNGIRNGSTSGIATVDSAATMASTGSTTTCARRPST